MAELKEEQEKMVASMQAGLEDVKKLLNVHTECFETLDKDMRGFKHQESAEDVVLATKVLMNANRNLRPHMLKWTYWFSTTWMEWLKKFEVQYPPPPIKKTPPSTSTTKIDNLIPFPLTYFLMMPKSTTKNADQLRMRLESAEDVGLATKVLMNADRNLRPHMLKWTYWFSTTWMEWLKKFEVQYPPPPIKKTLPSTSTTKIDNLIPFPLTYFLMMPKGKKF
ncbi:hypothetical protein CJ030_MR2G013161 [Morella rubra]|uniref:Uncharacterized protein n=1 Tax=Morella rubra TaxID=262757 RepID=A0A6A1WBT3_9ROSI|nr:hypothetical protein CJ030_MR2G013161 [Morella rubra]